MKKELETERVGDYANESKGGLVIGSKQQSSGPIPVSKPGKNNQRNVQSLGSNDNSPRSI